MSENHFSILKAEIEKDLIDLDVIINEWNDFNAEINERGQKKTDLRVAGSILHDFYTCIERIFSKIANSIDGELPTGGSWHSDLLDRMAIAIPNIRDRVIDDSVKQELYEYLRFRHLFRNVYGANLKWAKIENLVNDLDSVRNHVKEQITQFLDSLI
ncbi:MAG TPA: hypothetical protein VKM55_10380 [Candidatus Lokiarchaeia archaeon]|nr:hypothetical protein [Candidatus Lokiarchaeia archaeon]